MGNDNPPVLDYATPAHARPLRIRCWRWAVVLWALWVAGAAAVPSALVAMETAPSFAWFLGSVVTGTAAGFGLGMFCRRFLFKVETVHIAVCGVAMFIMVFLLVSMIAYDRPAQPPPSPEIAVVMPVAVHLVLGLIAVALRRRAQR